MPVKPSDFRLTFADRNFMWAAERRERLPILRWPDGSICEPVLAYFGYSAVNARVRISSMKPEAYAIREWLTFLENRGTRWDEASDRLLSEWRESHRDRIDRGEIEERQVERKIQCVFDFYRLLPKALPFDERGTARAEFVGRADDTTGGSYPITSKIVISPDVEFGEMWSGGTRFAKKGRKRKTPDSHQVGKVLTYLRGKPDHRVSRRRGKTGQSWRAQEAERNWLKARCMIDGGLRAEEVANLPLEAILEALRTESILIGLKRESGMHPLDALSEDEDGRERVLRALDTLESNHRKNLYVEVIGKGRKSRNAPMPIDLIRDLLTIGIWTVRYQQVADWKRRDTDYRAPEVLFLSFKTKRAMKPGTVADIMKDAFNAVGLDGSGHRLRAYYATMMADSLWQECFAMNGFRFDQTVVNMALDRLAEALGHRSVTVTVRHYLDMALLRHFGIANKGRLGALRKVWDALTRQGGHLSEGKIRLVTNVIAALAKLPEKSDLEEVISMAIADRTLSGMPGTDLHHGSARRPAWLRLVEASKADRSRPF